jgi:hypothetical protein
VVVTAFSEESVMDNMVDIQLVQQRITVLRILVSLQSIKQANLAGNSYLRNRGGEDYYFIELTYTLHKLVYARPFDHIYVVILTLNLNWYCEICLVKYL